MESFCLHLSIKWILRRQRYQGSVPVLAFPPKKWLCSKDLWMPKLATFEHIGIFGSGPLRCVCEVLLTVIPCPVSSAKKLQSLLEPQGCLLFLKVKPTPPKKKAQPRFKARLIKGFQALWFKKHPLDLYRPVNTTCELNFEMCALNMYIYIYICVCYIYIHMCVCEFRLLTVSVYLWLLSVCHGPWLHEKRKMPVPWRIGKPAMQEKALERFLTGLSDEATTDFFGIFHRWGPPWKPKRPTESTIYTGYIYIYIYSILLYYMYCIILYYIILYYIIFYYILLYYIILYYTTLYYIILYYSLS